MNDLSKILAENQREMRRRIAPSIKKPTILQNVEESDFETENNHPASTSTPIKSKPTLPNLPRHVAVTTYNVTKLICIDNTVKLMNVSNAFKIRAAS